MTDNNEHRLDLLKYLWRKRGLLTCGEFAAKLGIRADALAEIVERDIGPQCKPAFVIDGRGKEAWFHRDMIQPWETWLRNFVTPDDLARIKDIIMRHDKSQTVRNLTTYDNLEPHTYVISVLDARY